MASRAAGKARCVYGVVCGLRLVRLLCRPMGAATRFTRNLLHSSYIDMVHTTPAIVVPTHRCQNKQRCHPRCLYKVLQMPMCPISCPKPVWEETYFGGRVSSPSTAKSNWPGTDRHSDKSKSGEHGTRRTPC